MSQGYIFDKIRRSSRKQSLDFHCFGIKKLCPYSGNEGIYKVRLKLTVPNKNAQKEKLYEYNIHLQGDKMQLCPLPKMNTLVKVKERLFRVKEIIENNV